MMQFIETYHLTGVLVGLVTFLIIGLFHPLVIKGEYYFGVKCWWVFAFMGVGGIVASVYFYDNTFVSVSCGVFAFSSFWGVSELFEQRKRVEKGWFPKRKK
jgi:hypothetical protein